MKIKSIYIKGFRNFKESTIAFSEKSVIIGSNDIGKTNLLFAMRLLLDKSLSEAAIEPKDTDFYAYEPTDSFEIRIEFDDIVEECVIAKLRQNISDDNQLVLTYKAERQPASNKIDYKLFAGRDKDNLTEIDGRFYLKTLNLKFIGSKRDLLEYIRRERKSLLQDAKKARSEAEASADDTTLGLIEKDLENVGINVARLNYINKATDGVNAQLGELSYHHQGQQVVFDVGSSSPSEFVDELHLASQIQNRKVVVGGDGRNNQIHLALWSTRNQIVRDQNKEPLEVNIFCIEEPEAHLHPHQQRKLAQYLSKTLEGQVIITTHSPQIACEVPPESIIRLYSNGLDTLAAGNGVNPFSEAELINFGYRLNVISAEAFFANLVFLVEGPSEQLFYNALADAIGIDLDRLNISILIVDGVGFKSYASLLSSLKIPFVIRTDNDIFQIQKQKKYRLAGVQRAIGIYQNFFPQNEVMESLLKDQSLLVFDTAIPPEANIAYAQQIIEILESIGVFLSKIDLENDLYGELPTVTSEFFESDAAGTVSKMQKRKATSMFEFLMQESKKLESLSEAEIAKPLIYCKNIAQKNYGTPADS